MQQTLAFIHGGGHLPIELLALTASIFLFLYIKKENFNIWFSFASVVIIALVLLSMVCSIVGGFMHHKHEKKHGGWGGRRGMFRHEMGMGHMGMGRMGMGGMEWRGEKMHRDGEGREEENRPRTPEERATAVSERITKELSLNDDQKKKVYEAALVRGQKMKEAMEKDGDEHTDRRATMKPIMEAFDASMKTILNPEQYAKWKASNENRHREE
jgi:hypothetical protein